MRSNLSEVQRILAQIGDPESHLQDQNVEQKVGVNESKDAEEAHCSHHYTRHDEHQEEEIVNFEKFLVVRKQEKTNLMLKKII